MREGIAGQSRDAETRRRIIRRQRGIDRHRGATHDVVETKHERVRDSQVRRQRRRARGRRNAGRGQDDQTDIGDAEQARRAHRVPIVEGGKPAVNHLNGLRREYYL